VLEDVTVVGTTVHDVVPGAGEILSWRARHRSSKVAQWCQTRRV
jgi:hypothetical protein